MDERKMNSMQRVVAALQFKEPDRVPLFLLLSMYGAKELQIPVRDYFAKPDRVTQVQLLMHKKYRTDCLYTFFYAPLEVQAWGGEVIFAADGPVNAGEPFLKAMSQIDALTPPLIGERPELLRVLEVTENLKRAVGDTTPIIGVVMSPFSLPVMQLGFEKYLQLLYFNRPYFDKLMQCNSEFCISWANAQLQAGATAICYFDPLASPLIIDRNFYLETGYEVARRTIGRINGPTAVHLASANALPVIDDIARLGAKALGFSCQDDAAAMKAAAHNKICLLGNLNGVEMMHWTAAQTERNVKRVIRNAGIGGGFLLADNHGEIPLQVSQDVLLAIADAVDAWGEYPLEWVKQDEEA